MAQIACRADWPAGIALPGSDGNVYVIVGPRGAAPTFVPDAVWANLAATYGSGPLATSLFNGVVVKT